MQKQGLLGYWSVVSIGIGGMVGGGIFAVLGLAVQLARGGTPIAFLLSGIVALITTHAYVKLSVAYPSQGGTVTFLNQAFGRGYLSSFMNILLWLSYVVMLSLYAYAFGGYGASFFRKALQPEMRHIFITGIIILLTVLNLMGSKIVGESETSIVALKLLILCLFIFLGFSHVQFSHMHFSRWAPPLQLISGGMIIFLAYEGFELIANAAQDVKNPKKILPRAYYTAVIGVIFLYVLISMVTVGTLPFSSIIAARDYALAESARPFLGAFGFTLIAIAALLSTASAINATLYGASRVSYIIAKAGELPKRLERNIWKHPSEGLLLTAFLTLMVANFFTLSYISILGSAGFLIVFSMVNIASLKLSRHIGGSRIIPILGVLTCLLALLALLMQQFFNVVF